MNERELKQMFRLTANILRKKADFNFKYLTPKIIQVKIIRDKVKKNKIGKSRSLRYGFVQFREQQDAIQVFTILVSYFS